MSMPDERFNLAWYKTEVDRLQAELAALRADIEAKNKPLTIGELYSMRKKPVWLVYPIGEASRWTLLAMILDESMIYDSTHFVFEGTKRRYVLDVEDYGKKWLPYRTEQAARAAMEDDIK